MTRHPGEGGEQRGRGKGAEFARDIVTRGNYFYDCQAVRNAAEVLPEFNVPRVRNDPNACPPAACLPRTFCRGI